jgi:tetratricopeptide (TPR) repeat protein
MKAMFFILVATLLFMGAHANTKKADRLFEQWEYFRAATLYKKEAAKHPGADIYFKLGKCYQKMNLCNEEQAAYDKVNGYGTYSDPEFYLSYGQVLRTNGKNREAAIAFDKFTKLAPTDPRGNYFSQSIDIVAEDHNWDEPISITNVPSLNTPDADLCPVMYGDGIVFTSNRKNPEHNKIYGWTGANYLDLYFAKKGASDIEFTVVSTFGSNKIIKAFNDGPACFSKNFDTIYISRVNKDLKDKQKATLKIERNKIFMSVMTHNKWSKVIPFYLNNDTFSVANPFLTKDGSRLYFVSDMPGGYGETDIYYCNRENNKWGPPINMGPNVNTFNREKYPTIDSKGNFYFSSDGYQGFGGLDICVALNNDGVLAKAIPMKYPINSPSDDFAIMFLKEDKAGYITSSRGTGGMGDDDIFYFNLQRDQIDTCLTTSEYTIGYRPKLHDPILTPEPIATIRLKVPKDILIHFDYDRAQIRPDAIVHLDTVLRYMNEFPALILLVTGHCDCRGTSDYNADLADRRSEATVRYLAKRGIDANRMTSEGYGIHNLPNRCEKGVNYTDPEYQKERSAYIRFKETWIKNTDKVAIQKTEP